MFEELQNMNLSNMIDKKQDTVESPLHSVSTVGTSDGHPELTGTVRRVAPTSQEE
mgnify:CR=1 FL=1